MADVVDAFVVTLGLKDDDFVRHARIVLELQNRMRKEAQTQHKEQQLAATQTVASFNEIRRSALGLATVILGGMGITEFVQHTIALTANVGRLSTDLKMSTMDIAAWQGAIRAMGGTSEEASGDLMKIVQAFEDIQLTGTSPMIPVLRQLGFSLSDLSDPTQFLLKLSDRLSAMPDKREAFNLGSRLGLSPEMVNLLIQGRKATLEYLDAAKQAYPITQQDTQTAIEAQKQWSLLVDAWRRVGNTILVELAPALIKLADGLEKVALWFQSHPDAAMIAFGAAMYFAAAGAFRLAAGLLTAGGAAAGAAARLAPIAAILAGAAAMTGPGGGGAFTTQDFFRTARNPRGASDADLASALQWAQQGGEPVAGSNLAGYLAAIRAEVARRKGGAAAGSIGAAMGIGGGGDFFGASPAWRQNRWGGWVLGGDDAELAAPPNFNPNGTIPSFRPARSKGAGVRSNLGSLVATIAARMGVDPETARGIGMAVAGEGATSWNQRDEYDAAGHFAYGAFQFRGKEQKALFAEYGPNPTLAQQVAFFLKRSGAAGWHMDATAAMKATILQYLQPGPGTAGDLRRGAASTITIGALNVYTQPGADGRQIGRDAYAEIVAQANPGLS